MAQPIIASDASLAPEQICRTVARVTGRAANADLERQVLVVVTLLGARLDRTDREEIAKRVGPGLEAAMNRDLRIDDSAAAFESALNGRGVEPAIACATCTALAEALGEQGRCHLRLSPLRPWLLVFN